MLLWYDWCTSLESVSGLGRGGGSIFSVLRFSQPKGQELKEAILASSTLSFRSTALVQRRLAILLVSVDSLDESSVDKGACRSVGCTARRRANIGLHRRATCTKSPVREKNTYNIWIGYPSGSPDDPHFPAMYSSFERLKTEHTVQTGLTEY